MSVSPIVMTSIFSNSSSKPSRYFSGHRCIGSEPGQRRGEAPIHRQDVEQEPETRNPGNRQSGNLKPDREDSVRPRIRLPPEKKIQNFYNAQFLFVLKNKLKKLKNRSESLTAHLKLGGC